MPYFSIDDIVQISSPPGRGAVGILRISGPNAFAIAAGAIDEAGGLLAERQRGCRDCSFRLPLRVHTREGKGNAESRPCPARLFTMPAPASYTREDVVEIHLPGSQAILQAGMNALIRCGARPAAPGEFTFRAFRNGRLNLAQAEAVEETIRSSSDLERQKALSRLGDPTTGKILGWRDKVMDIAAQIEAALDFDEEEIGENPAAELALLVDELNAEGIKTESTAARTAADLPEAALVGLSNAGKSSLFNALLEQNTALVSPELSTTRDLLRREVKWHGVNLYLSDNPGHDPENKTAGGMAARQAMSRLGGADLHCWVVDRSQGVGSLLEDFAGRLSGRVILVLNKCDLEKRLDETELISLASSNNLTVAAICTTRADGKSGLEELRRAVSSAVKELDRTGAWNRRETLELSAALKYCRAAHDELAGAARLELVAEELRAALAAFSHAVGEGYAEDALERIFSRFCLGK
jgi:small GTP-binding protein domain